MTPLERDLSHSHSQSVSSVQQTTSVMPVNTWNFFRAVTVGSDHASWLSQNPQVEEGRIGGNQEFDGDVRDQYQYEVAHMMRRLRLNFYRAEDAMLVLKKRQWAEEDAALEKQEKERKRKLLKKRFLQNKERRLRRESGLSSNSFRKVSLTASENHHQSNIKTIHPIMFPQTP